MVVVLVSMNFKAIPGHSRYEISYCGNVLDLKTGKCVAIYVDRRYLRCSIRLETGKHSIRKIHVLLALTWIPNPDNKPTVDHWDCNPSNNSLDNLRWATRQEQNWNRVAQGWYHQPDCTKNPYEVKIKNNSGKNIHLGFFSTSDEAQIVYEEKCIEWRGIWAPKIYHDRKRLRQLNPN